MYRGILFFTIISTLLFCKSVIAHLVDPLKRGALKTNTTDTNNFNLVFGPVNKHVKNFKGETTSQSFFGQTKCVTNYFNSVKLALTISLKKITGCNLSFSSGLRVVNVIRCSYEYILEFETSPIGRKLCALYGL